MPKLKTVIMILFCPFLIMQASFAQKASTNISIAIVDVKAVVEAMPEYPIAEKMLKDLNQKYQDSLVKMQQDYLKRLDQYQKQKNMMTNEQQQKEEQKFQQEQQDLLKFREDKTNEIMQKRDDYIEPIRQKIRKAIAEVAKEEGITFVFDKTSDAVLYGEDKYDLTYRVIDKIKRGNSEKQ